MHESNQRSRSSDSSFTISPFWDGKAADRIVKIIDNIFPEEINTGTVHENKQINV